MHIVVWIPARVIAGLCPDGIAAPAVVDPVFIQVEPPVGDPFLTQHFFCDLGHDAGISCTVGTAVDQQNIKWFSIVGELHMLCFTDELTRWAVAVGATLWRFFTRKDKTTDSAFPGYY